MPAQSKQQQKFMGLVHAIQKGDVPASDASPEAQKVAQDMKPSDVKDFASTSHKGLPKKVKESILKKLKEYAMTLPNHHAKSAAPMEPLRSDDEMDLQEDRIPQSFNYGTTRDYHTKLATTPRKKYDKTNFNPAHSGQEDLQEGDDKLEMLKLFNKALRMMPGSQKQKEIIKQLNVIRSRNGLKPLDEKQVVNKIAEYAANLDNSYILNKDAKLDGTPDEKDAINREVKSVKESSPCWKGYKQVGMKPKGGRQVPNCVKESVNELKLNDLVGNQYKYVIGSGEEKHLGKNDKKYVLEMIAKSLKAYLYDDDFALNYLDGSQRREYNTFFEKEVLAPMLKKVDFTLNNFFTLDKDKVKWKLSSSDTRKMVDEIFRKNSKVPSDIKKEYYTYRLEYAGVKLKESVNESDLKGYLVADVVDDIIKSIGTRFVSGQVKNGGNKNKVYLKLTDKKFGSGVVKILKSRFGIDSKYDTTFGHMPSISFWGDKVISESVNEVSASDVIKDLDKVKNDLLKKVDVLVAKKKKLYSNVDIESPMSADEKKLDKDIADLFSQINKLVLQKRNLKKESVNEVKVHFKKELKNGNIFQVVDRDTAGMRGTQDKFKMQIVDKRGKVIKDLGSHPSLSGAEKFGKRFESVNEELSFNEKEMVIGIIEILKQVEDPKNRMRIALNMLNKFKEEGIEFDYQKFVDALKEYSMGSYEYDKGSRELGESIIKSMKDVVYKLLPTNTLARHANDPNKNKEFVDKIVRELGSLLNRFYKQNDIDVVLR